MSRLPMEGLIMMVMLGRGGPARIPILAWMHERKGRG
jgi:hypothetical protein